MTQTICFGWEGVVVEVTEIACMVRRWGSEPYFVHCHRARWNGTGLRAFQGCSGGRCALRCIPCQSVRWRLESSRARNNISTYSNWSAVGEQVVFAAAERQAMRKIDGEIVGSLGMVVGGKVDAIACCSRAWNCASSRSFRLARLAADLVG